ncbi:helix-turn-helix domain-containing protein [Pseudoxanthomonas dokdonensis]|uniref:helix-turn-helix domain-containing protein n=1 Tax=Pseudoxanthomonas dokdonensis TaxID=344882 RepID=UPI00070C090F|nr:helix-turn-helix domain-containing protein [Pseudoxanthomonas dokdonensis]
MARRGSKPGHFGQESKYTPELADKIVRRVSEGKTISDCAREFDFYRGNVRDWRAKYPDFDHRMAVALDEGYDAIADHCLVIADDSSGDYREGKDGAQFDSENVQRSKLKVHTRMQLLEKWSPLRYGARKVLAGDPDAPLVSVPDDQLDSRIKELLAKEKG